MHCNLGLWLRRIIFSDKKEVTVQDIQSLMKKVI